LAIDTESGAWVWIDGVDNGPVFAVAGQPKSGRGSTLVALARLVHDQGWGGAQRAVVAPFAVGGE
jgi:hypothetical protein